VIQAPKLEPRIIRYESSDYKGPRSSRCCRTSRAAFGVQMTVENANTFTADSNNIFANLDALRLSPDDPAVAGTSEILSHVPVRKPDRHEFFRTRSEPEFWFGSGIFEDKEEREVFFVAPRMRDALVGEIKPVLLVPVMTRQGVMLLWPLKLPTDGPGRSWAETARQASELAKTKWVRLVPDMGLGGYRIFMAEGSLSEPEWPDKPLEEILQIAFRDRIVDSENHPVIRRLRGLA
jgi:hypothetical protein